MQYSYRATLEASERIGWVIDDVIGADKRLDFSKPFMPEGLARTGLDFLDPEERLALNQIRGHGYLCMFGLVEEFILPFILDHARPLLHGDDYRTRALLQFACEEAKHIQLFRRFRTAFEAGFGVECEVIGPPREIARQVLAHHPLAVALVTLHIEWMTQRHYLESVKDDGDLDPQFKSLLRHHWMEEAQHAKLDTLVVEALVEQCSEKDRAAALEDYFRIGAFIDAGLAQQVEFDAASLHAATGRSLDDSEMAQFRRAQLQAQRWTFLGSGMTHPNVLATAERVSPSARQRIEEAGRAFS